MSDIDLSDEIMQPAVAAVIDHPQLIDSDAIDLAWTAVEAVLPGIVTALREQIARDIESGTRRNDIAYAHAARIARGES